MIDLLDGEFRSVGLQKQIFQRNGFYGFADFPILVPNAFSDGEEDSPVDELLSLFFGTVEAMDDPFLYGLMLFVKPEYLVGGADVVDDERFLVLFRKLDVFFENIQLKR